jgi:hypothetical protein
MAVWRFDAHDLRTNAKLAELPLADVEFSDTLNGAGDFSAKLPLSGDGATSATTSASIAALLTSSSIPERTALYMYRGGTLRGGGIIWSRRRAKGRPAEIQGAGFWSYFRTQHLRTTQTFAAQDQLAIARSLVTVAQAVTGSDIGVVTGSETSGVLRDRTYNSWELKQIGEAVEQLAAVDNGFDFAIDLSDGPTKTLTLSYPRRGRIAGSTGVVFVDGKNLLDYEVVEDGTRSARLFTAVGAGDGLDMLLSTQARTDLIDAGYPATSATKAYKDVTVQATLDAHAIAEVNARANTPTFWTVTVDPDDPDGGIGTWIVGDDALLDIPDDDNFPRQSDGSSGYRAYHRIVASKIQIPAAGKETVTLTLGPVI